MTTAGQLTAKVPVSPHPNIKALARAGATKFGTATWRLVCACGQTITADAPAVRRGRARCPTCNPSYGMLQAQRVLDLLPCGYHTIETKLGWGVSHAAYRVRSMRASGLCHVGGWKRPKGPGMLAPIFYAGPGADAPCHLTRRTDADYSRAWRRRVKKAIQKAAAGGRDDGRYSRHIARHLAGQVERQARAQPQTWLSALFAKETAC